VLPSGFSGRVGAEEIRRGVISILVSAAAMLIEAIGPAGRCSGGVGIYRNLDLLVEAPR
jgi:hypothetical protein